MARVLFSTRRILDRDCPDCHDDDFWCGSFNCISDPRPLNAEEQAELAKDSEPIDLRAILGYTSPQVEEAP